MGSLILNLNFPKNLILKVINNFKKTKKDIYSLEVYEKIVKLIGN